MKLRTTDQHVEQATNKFFEDLGLEQPALEYFGGATVKEKLSEGYGRYKLLLKKAMETVPEGAEKLANDVVEKLTIPAEDYEQYVYEIFKEKIDDIFHPAATYIEIKPQMINLFQEQESDDLLQLVMSAMDEFLEGIVSRFENLVVLLLEGIPMEIAEEIASKAGDDEVVPVKVEVHSIDGDADEEDDEGKKCDGECGEDCKCAKGEHEGHCQCEGGCKCGNHSDE